MTSWVVPLNSTTLDQDYLQKYCSSVLQTWHQKRTRDLQNHLKHLFVCLTNGQCFNAGNLQTVYNYNTLDARGLLAHQW